MKNFERYMYNFLSLSFCSSSQKKLSRGTMKCLISLKNLLEVLTENLCWALIRSFLVTNFLHRLK